MNRSSMLQTNAMAIEKFDQRDISSAKKLFADNMRTNPSALTKTNYANFLIDEHSMPSPSITSDAIFFLRKCRAKHLLDAALRQAETDESAYHILCLLGRMAFDQGKVKRAKACFSEAYQLNPQSIEAVSILAWIAFIEKRFSDLSEQLKLLGHLLHLGSNVSDNLDILFESTPFLVFPYYQLLILSYLMTGDEQQASSVFDDISLLEHPDADPLFPPDELLALALKLKKYDYLPIATQQMEHSLRLTSERINYLFFEWQKDRKAFLSGRVCCQRLGKMTSLGSKLLFICKARLSKRYKCEIFLRTVMLNNKECHYLECPIHGRQT